MSYTHLSAEERIEFYKLRANKDISLRNIAKEMNRSPSTLSRELQRNSLESELYIPDIANQKQQERREHSKKAFENIRVDTIVEIKRRLKKYHSPEQIAGRLKLEGKERVSHETIYKMIYENHEGLGKYRKYLRQGRGKRKQRNKVKARQGGIIGRVGIENRPAIADEKTEIGHWESDTMIGGNHHGVIVTHVDKASKFLVAGLGKNKTAEEINKVTLELFSKISIEDVKTMTFDNGKEFSGHAKIAEELDVLCFFATPYHSWERGLNEHTNGLLRQFFPKGTNFLIVKPKDLENAVNLINNRPRKSLDYRTPFEVFYRHTSDSVALQI
jgi:transposase, IS30 family